MGMRAIENQLEGEKKGEMEGGKKNNLVIFETEGRWGRNGGVAGTWRWRGHGVGWDKHSSRSVVESLG